MLTQGLILGEDRDYLEYAPVEFEPFFRASAGPYWAITGDTGPAIPLWAFENRPDPPDTQPLRKIAQKPKPESGNNIDEMLKPEPQVIAPFALLEEEQGLKRGFEAVSSGDETDSETESPAKKIRRQALTREGSSIRTTGIPSAGMIYLKSAERRREIKRWTDQNWRILEWSEYWEPVPSEVTADAYRCWKRLLASIPDGYQLDEVEDPRTSVPTDDAGVRLEYLPTLPDRIPPKCPPIVSYAYRYSCSAVSMRDVIQRMGIPVGTTNNREKTRDECKRACNGLNMRQGRWRSMLGLPPRKESSRNKTAPRTTSLPKSEWTEYGVLPGEPFGPMVSTILIGVRTRASSKSRPQSLTMHPRSSTNRGGQRNGPRENGTESQEQGLRYRLDANYSVTLALDREYRYVVQKVFRWKG